MNRSLRTLLSAFCVPACGLALFLSTGCEEKAPPVPLPPDEPTTAPVDRSDDRASRVRTSLKTIPYSMEIPVLWKIEGNAVREASPKRGYPLDILLRDPGVTIPVTDLPVELSTHQKKIVDQPATTVKQTTINGIDAIEILAKRTSPDLYDLRLILYSPTTEPGRLSIHELSIALTPEQFTSDEAFLREIIGTLRREP
jgi:hypothetical protein